MSRTAENAENKLRLSLFLSQEIKDTLFGSEDIHKTSFFDLKDINKRCMLYALNENNCCVGVVCFEPNSKFKKDSIELCFIEVFPSFQNQGIGKFLANAIKLLATQLSKCLLIGFYTEEGELYLKKHLEKPPFS